LTHGREKKKGERKEKVTLVPRPFMAIRKEKRGKGGSFQNHLGGQKKRRGKKKGNRKKFINKARKEKGKKKGICPALLNRT